jgi:lysophospholipase L1-like esterase
MGFHANLGWPARLETLLRLACVWASVPRLPVPPAPAGLVAGRPPPLDLAGFGDSIIAGIGVAAQADGLVARVAAHLAQDGIEVRWRSVGVSGATGRTLAGLLDAPLEHDPHVILVSCGVNDVVRGRPPQQLAHEFTQFLRRARARWPHAQVVHVGVPPLESFPALTGRLGEILGRHGRSCIAALRAAASESGALYVAFPAAVGSTEFSRDGFHPNELGCAIWAGFVARAIEAAGLGAPAAPASVPPGRPQHGVAPAPPLTRPRGGSL